jgi:PST family polysaccharide transporter
LQGEAVSYARYFRLFVSILAGVSFPFVALLIIFADSLILLMLGKGWAPSVVLFHRLGWAALAQPLGQALGVLLITSGLSRRYLLWGAMHSAIMVASFFIGLPWGPNGIATSYAIANYIVFFPSLIFCTHGTYVSATLILRSISLPALATAVAAWWVLFTKTILPLENQFLQLGVYASMFAVVYILPYFFFQSSRAELASFFKLGKRVFLCRE